MPTSTSANNGLNLINSSIAAVTSCEEHKVDECALDSNLSNANDISNVNVEMQLSTWMIQLSTIMESNVTQILSMQIFCMKTMESQLIFNRSPALTTSNLQII